MTTAIRHEKPAAYAEIYVQFAATLKAEGQTVQVIGGASEAAALDAQRAIEAGFCAALAV